MASTCPMTNPIDAACRVPSYAFQPTGNFSRPTEFAFPAGFDVPAGLYAPSKTYSSIFNREAVPSCPTPANYYPVDYTSPMMPSTYPATPFGTPMVTPTYPVTPFGYPMVTPVTPFGTPMVNPTGPNTWGPVPPTWERFGVMPGTWGVPSTWGPVPPTNWCYGPSVSPVEWFNRPATSPVPMNNLYNVAFRPSNPVEFYCLTNPIRVLDREGNRQLWLCFDLRGYKPEEVTVTLNKAERCVIVEACHEVKEKEHQVMRKFSRRVVLPESLAKCDLSKCELKSCLNANGMLTIECMLPRMTSEEIARCPVMERNFINAAVSPYSYPVNGYYGCPSTCNTTPITCKVN